MADQAGVTPDLDSFAGQSNAYLKPILRHGNCSQRAQ
jgi:hypothetical protein